MIREALKYLIGLGEVEIHHEDGQAYSDKQMHLLEQPVASELEVSTLSSLVDYLKSDISTIDEVGGVLLHINDPTEVIALSTLNNNKNRDKLIRSIAPIPNFNFDNWYDTETFNIKLQSCFVKNDDRDVMLKVVGNIKEESVNNYGDDGVSQSVVAKAGVASVANVEVPNPVLLAPYRTFTEVEQPESDFVFRMKSGPSCAIFEADGGKWKIEAINNIKTYLMLSLKEEIENGRVTIIA